VKEKLVIDISNGLLTTLRMFYSIPVLIVLFKPFYKVIYKITKREFILSGKFEYFLDPMNCFLIIIYFMISIGIGYMMGSLALK